MDVEVGFRTEEFVLSAAMSSREPVRIWRNRGKLVGEELDENRKDQLEKLSKSAHKRKS